MSREKQIAIDCIKEFCEANDHGFRDNYSGRSMYGRTCVGIVTDSNPLWLVLCIADELHNSGVDSVEDVLGEPVVDSMGLSTIVYFPRLKVGD